MSDYREGFKDGWNAAHEANLDISRLDMTTNYPTVSIKPKRKRKLSDWQKYVKVNSKKPRFKFKSGSKKGRVNFKALGIAFRKTPAGKKKRR